MYMHWRRELTLQEEKENRIAFDSEASPYGCLHCGQVTFAGHAYCSSCRKQLEREALQEMNEEAKQNEF